MFSWHKAIKIMLPVQIASFLLLLFCIFCSRWIRVEKFLGVFFLMAQIEVVSQCVWHRDRRVILALEIYHNTYFDCDCLHSHKRLCGTLTYINHIILINREAYLPFDPVGAADQDMPSIEIRVNQS